ncbi:MAG TPA: bifunctional riboflavin kinase/FAD synthetase [Myxococcales bacterium]|nr:bifunctional riboflavin kinase/FAD synthetase [Myxococcales bacterium]HIN86513.1 bifunctional riboflavin kinase/FAD synthetase [Myxococcales bacterium]
MELVQKISQFPIGLPHPVVTLGNFDGVHLGHRHLIKRLIALAKERNGVSVLLTFRPHPVKILHPEKAPSLIGGYDDKLAILEELGIDWVLEIPFDRDFSEWEAGRFIDELLVDTVGVKYFLAGPDCHFGKGRAGDADMLSEYGTRSDFEVESVPPIEAEGDIVSSSRIRRLVSDLGDVETAARLLGRPMRIRGDVVKGEQRGRLLGFPTANLRLETELVPKTGVYAATAHRHGQRYKSVVNVGHRPTFGKSSLSIEAFLLDFDDNLYGESLALDLIARLRDEQRFDGIDALKAQINLDIEKGRALLS